MVLLEGRKGEWIMDTRLMQKLRKVTEEEANILAGSHQVQKNLYTAASDFTVDCEKMMSRGTLFDIRTHTRFIRFPKHRHNYIEIMYMCEGATTHIINDTEKVVLEKGDLLFLHQTCFHEIEAAGENDIGVNFIVLPEFFHTAFDMMEEENVLSNFIISSLTGDGRQCQYLHFQVAEVLPIQNLIENMVWSIERQHRNDTKINRVTMGLLFLQLLEHTDRIASGGSSAQLSQAMAVRALRYIEERYMDGTLTELAEREHQSLYQMSRYIKAETGYTFKEILQMKRFQVACSLLKTSSLSVSDIISMVGYDNTSYFYRRFQEKYHMSPREYRLKDNS